MADLVKRLEELGDRSFMKEDQDTCRLALDRIRALNKECSTLSAGMCHGGYGDEGGSWRCKYQDRIEALEAELLAFKLAYMDALSAVDFAASEGFEWPVDPITPDIKYVSNTYAVNTVGATTDE